MHHQLFTVESTANGLVAIMRSLPDLIRFLRLPVARFMFDLQARYLVGSAVFEVHRKD
jgi:hypothetical protein